jgi:Protein of unknown function (DUF2849)
MKLLTANRLKDGVVLWYRYDQWVEDASLALAMDDTEADQALAQWKGLETQVVSPYLIPVDAEAKPIRREQVREMIRANGPTIGPTAQDTAKALNRSDVFTRET